MSGARASGTESCSRVGGNNSVGAIIGAQPVLLEENMSASGGKFSILPAPVA